MDKKIHKLNIRSASDFVLIGISSHENDYRVSWSINNSLSFKLTKTDNLKLYNEKLKVEQEFTVFFYSDEESYLRYNLISNRCENGFLLPEYKNIDYFILIKGDIQHNDVNSIISLIRKSEIVTAAFILNDIASKSADKFISFQ